MSAWNSTMMITTAEDRKLSRIRPTVASWSQSEATRVAISTRRPIRIWIARVPLMSSRSQYTPRVITRMSIVSQTGWKLARRYSQKPRAWS
jgi:hypothetical protein